MYEEKMRYYKTNGSGEDRIENLGGGYGNEESETGNCNI